MNAQGTSRHVTTHPGKGAQFKARESTRCPERGRLSQPTAAKALDPSVSQYYPTMAGSHPTRWRAFAGSQTVTSTSARRFNEHHLFKRRRCVFGVGGFDGKLQWSKVRYIHDYTRSATTPTRCLAELDCIPSIPRPSRCPGPPLSASRTTLILITVCFANAVSVTFSLKSVHWLSSLH
ncbi:hypothetical protein BKA62DRAFT_162013 [Auriculariales sp. MPI-PUGE-AT-0066]|nr:hypothetical protein BKA62DRAFT_162013 [Auriculariales sp. MPI-PUGE-AT-0066]